MRRLVLAIGAAGLLWSGLPAGIASASSTAIQSTSLAIQASTFVACVKARQGAAPHRTSLAEARACEMGLPEIARSRVATTRPLPHLFLVVDGSRAALEGSGLPQPGDPSNSAYASCYNTYTNPWPSWFFFIDGGSLNSHGYGNHCGYANMTGITPSAWCAPGCWVTVSSGTADSNWDYYHYGIRSALGWANFQFNGSVNDFWACRAYVDTNGNQNPSSYCS